MTKKLILIPLLFINLVCSCANTYQRMAADNIKDMMIGVKVLDTGYATFYKTAAEKLMTNPDWLDSAHGKSFGDFVKDFQMQMKYYDDTIVKMQECRNDLKALAKTFDTQKRLSDSDIKKEIEVFDKYKQLLIQMVVLKVSTPSSLLSLSEQVCLRNEKIAKYFKIPAVSCNFINKFGDNHGTSN